VISGTDKSCVSTCGTKFENALVTPKVCTTDCNTSYHHAGATNQCKSACNQSGNTLQLIEVTGTNKTCVITCSSAKPYIDEVTDAANPTCVADCGINYRYDGTPKKCVSSCNFTGTTFQYINVVDGKNSCVSTCNNTNKYVDATTRPAN